MIEEKQIQPTDKKEKKKLSPTSKAILIVIVILATAFIIYLRFDHYKKEIQDMANDTGMSILGSILFVVGFIIVFVLIVLGLIYAKKKGFLFKIEDTFKVLILKLWVPLSVIIILLLGSIHQTYPYESGWEKNMTASLGNMGGAGVSIFNSGAKFPLWALLLIIAAFFSFAIEEIIHIWKKPNKTKEEIEKEEQERKAKE